MCQIAYIRCRCRHGRIPSKDQQESFCEFGRNNCPQPIVLIFQEMIKCDKCNEEDSNLTKSFATTYLDLGVKQGSDDTCGDEEKENPSECDEDFTLPDRAFDRNPTGAASSAAKENVALLSETFESIIGLIIEL